MIKVEKIIPGGFGLGTCDDGKKAFFWNVLPGETIVEYNITKQKSHYIEAIATKIENSSNFRKEPKDKSFLSTSPWQIMDYDYELKLKQELVVEIFREHQIDISLPEIFTDHKDYYYRNKMEYALFWDNEENKIKLAFHARGSHRKIPINQSSIERQEIFQAATKIVDELNRTHEEARKYQSLLLRCSQKGEVSGGLYENHKPHPAFKKLTDEILGYTYSYSPNGFFQINLPVYEMALNEIKKHINTDNVLDLYAGVGTIGLSVARDKNLTLVEVDKYAFKELKENAKTTLQHFKGSAGAYERGGRSAPPVTTEQRSEREPSLLGSPNEAALSRNETGRRDSVPEKCCNVVLSKSEAALDYINLDQTVILDPPRSGCDKKLIDRLNEVKPEKIIYLSCNPATQARDIKLLLDNYKIKDIKTFNFFPHTPHIENLVILQKSC